MFLVRNSEIIDDKRRLPFLRDMVQLALLVSKSGDDTIFLTNGDVCFAPMVTQMILSSPKPFYCHRRDFYHKLDKPLTTAEVQIGHEYPGNDAFGFTPAWWAKHGGEFPDMLIGATGWDWVMRVLMQETGGVSLPNAIYHEHHKSLWHNKLFRRTNKAQRWNQKLAAEFLTKRGVSGAEIRKYT
jgi:hypothetical protein